MAHEELGLVRPTPTSIFRVLVCKNPECNPPDGCGDSWEIDLLDDGRWAIECRHCDNVAAMFADFMDGSLS